MEHDKETKEWSMTKGRGNGAGQRDKRMKHAKGTRGKEQGKCTREWSITKGQGNGAGQRNKGMKQYKEAWDMIRTKRQENEAGQGDKGMEHTVRKEI